MRSLFKKSESGQLNAVPYANYWDMQVQKSTIDHFQSWNILPKENLCPNGHPMYLYIVEEDSKHSRWMCKMRGRRSDCGIRKSNWLEGSKLPDVKILFIYSWSKGLTSINFCYEDLGVNHKTIVDFAKYLRKVCADEFFSNKKKRWWEINCRSCRVLKSRFKNRRVCSSTTQLNGIVPALETKQLAEHPR